MDILKTDTPILVPINVQAICIGNDDATKASFVQRDVDFSLLPNREDNLIYNDYAYISEHIESQPFSSDRVALPKGIHLHWALPDALTNGTVNNTISKSSFENRFGAEDGALIWKELLENQWLVLTEEDLETAHFNELNLLPAEFQALSEKLKKKQTEIKRFLEEQEITFNNVPNRWVISRITKDDEGNLDSKSWVVESDLLTTDDFVDGIKNTNTTVRYQSKSSSKPYSYLGAKHEFKDWSDNGSDAEYYPKLTVAGSGEQEFASYYPNCSSVFGFHDDLSDLSDKSTVSYQVTGFYSNKKDDSKDPFLRSKNPKDLLKEFKWKVDDDLSGQQIYQTLYTGTASGIQWDETTDYLQELDDSNIDVAFADTEIEALNTLQTDDQHQQFMTAWLMGIHHYLDQPDGLFKIDSDTHANRFSKDSAGILWAIVDATDAISTGSLPAAPSDLEELPADVLSKLENLNSIQEQINRLNMKIISMRSRLFSDWQKFLIQKYDTLYYAQVDGFAMNNEISSTVIREFIEQIDQVELTNMLNTISNPDQEGDDLTKQLTEAQNELQKAVDNLKESRKYALTQTPAPAYQQGNDPFILFKSENLNTWQYAGNRNRMGTDGGELPCRLPKDILTPDNETQFFDYEINGDFVLILNKLLNEAAIFIDNTYDQVKNDHSGYTGDGTLPPQMAVNQWNESNPYLVMQIHWKVYFSGLKRDESGNYDCAYITDHFSFSNESKELQIDPKYLTSDNFDQEQTLTGKCVLTPNISRVATYQIDRSLEEYQDDEELCNQLKAVRKQFSDSEGAILAQELAGFNDALVMNRQSFQLEVDDPLAAVFDDSFTTTVSAGVSEQNYNSPLPHNQYHPIRTGLVRVDAIRIIDCFGRFHDMPTTHVSYSPEMHLMNTVGNYNALLPPRITQSSRLVTEYLKADDEDLTEHTSENPIYGWILVNSLENSLMLYSTDGTNLGSLRHPLISSDVEIIWQSSVGKAAVPIDKALASVNPHFSDFITTIQKDRVYFNTVVKSIVDGQRNMSTKIAYNNGLAHLLGNPVAFVRGKTDLQLKGLPEMNESWKALGEDIQSATNGQDDRSTSNFTQINFPVLVGNSDQQSDGVYGFYKESNSYFDYKTSGSLIDISAEEDKAQTLNMLINPTLPVHINTGILPEQKLQIPQQYYEDALRNISATFLTAPVLINEDDLKMPLAKMDGWEWTFLQKQGATWLKAKDDIADASNEATYSSSQRKIVEGWLQLKRRPNNND